MTGSILYGYTAAIRSNGSGTDYLVGDQIGAYNVGTGSRYVFGGAREAWSGDHQSSPLTTSTLIGFEPSIIAQHDNNDRPLLGVDVVFKNRPDGVAAPKMGLGANSYNKFSRAIQISSQPRSTSLGEYSGWTAGITFTPDSLDRSSSGLAVGIDMSAVNSGRLAAAIRMPADGKLTWDGDSRSFGITSGSLVYGVSGLTPFTVSSAGDLSVSGKIREITSAPPLSSNDSCLVGQRAWDASYEYRCVATNTWKRAALTSW
jgi:hypothetical protein